MMRRAATAILFLLAALAAAPERAEAQNRFWLVNDSGRVVERAFVSASRVADWGPDILGAAVLPPGQRVWVTPNFADCVLDIRVTFQGGGEEARMEVNACTLSQVVFARSPAPPGAAAGTLPGPGRAVAANPSFNLVNASGLVIREVYASLTSDETWGRDRLGTRVLAPGERLAVSLPATGLCTVDIRVVYLDGRVAERRAVETCGLTDLAWR